ncbi:glutamate--tRNA ligase family protein [Candidatus Carsonella ruddii]|uniref:Glutaminyl-tRNA synthetase n=1 Tax=Candidatus Carsonella ruddii CE isolate Thao2000 TaxID=1202536 RepID=J7GZW8_CARRU|nr:glutamate--tRNA ligase family protein [Candidatus Carsonella ruddii]AFP83555.1 glutaminyl-tRNA synthetase [Candidatus Carsonella ruddii CE isolate Thao2000]
MINNYFKNFCKKKDNFRFPPDPNGFLHIGHVFSIIFNKILSKIYFGNFYLRFDNTNLTYIKNFFYKKIKIDVLWLGIKWIHKTIFFLNNIKKYYYYLCFFLKKKKIILKKKFILVFIFSNYKVKNLLFYFILFKNNFYNIYEIVFIIKKKIIFRIKNYKKKIFPTYDFSQCINDYLNNINVSICTNEFKNNSIIYYYILKKIYFKKKIIQIEFEKKKINNKLLSKKKLTINYYNLYLLREKGYSPNFIFLICNIVGITKNYKNINNNKFLFCISKEKKFIFKKNFFYFYFFFCNIKKNLIKSYLYNEKNLNLKNLNLNINNKINFYFKYINFYLINNFIFFYKKKFFFKNKFFFILLKKKKNKNVFFVNKKKNYNYYYNKMFFKKNILK